MNPISERMRYELLAAKYLLAIETDDFATQEALWHLAETEPDLVTLFQQVHDDLLEEEQQAEVEKVTQAIEESVEQHLPGAAVVKEPSQAVSFADVAAELLRSMPNEFSSDELQYNDSLRSRVVPLPDDLGLSNLITHAEAAFGPAPREYWQAFQKLAIRLRMRHADAENLQLAARREPKKENRS